MRTEAPTASAAGEISLFVDKQPTASGGLETQDYGEQLDIMWLSTDPHDVENPDHLRILIEVEAQDAAARPEHDFTEAGIVSRRADHRIPGLPG